MKQTGRVLCIVGGALVLFALVAVVAATIYDRIVPGTDMSVPGFLAGVMLGRLAPLGGVLLVVGGLIWIGASFAGRRSNEDHTERD